jgi:poly-gamma-glutamate capsule biosynthesis protein CapA/YwtB (metallophosphatase superfamily)
MRELIDGRFVPPLPHSARDTAERAALSAMRFRRDGGRVHVRDDVPTASLVAVGDISFKFDEDAEKGSRRERVARVVPALREADLRVANLESVLTVERRQAGPSGSFLRGAPVHLETLAAAGIDAVTCANNHCLDYGPGALAESLAHLRDSGIAACGAGEGEAARAPVLLQARGLRVGMLGYADDCNVAPRWDAGPRAAEVEDAHVLEDLRQLRPRVDLVVLQLHWGYEWAMYPLLSHRERARRFVEAGADVVLCHHAHVPMGVEAWRGGVIAHGLGNFLFGWRPPHAHPWRNRAHLLRVDFNERGVTGATIIPCGTVQGDQVLTLAGRARREVLGAHSVLRRGLADDRMLAALEADRTIRHARTCLLAAARAAERGAADVAQGVARSLHLPRQRALRAALDADGLDGGPEVATLLRSLADAAHAPGAALAAASQASSAPVRHALRRLSRERRLRHLPLGRIP